MNQRKYLDDGVEELVIPATEDDLQWLARLIQAEAEDEPYDGKVAVASVVVNRVKHPDFPWSITRVIMQPGQFESYENGHLAEIIHPNEECLEAAIIALKGYDPTFGSLYFFNPEKTRNRWLRQKEVKLSVGKHFFVL